ncbi:MAG: phosphate ABC transporter permease PstA [Planctomycetia bacterium]|nr:phosphate ABC transporter permease PstA [Planctomycetia bacterium]
MSSERVRPPRRLRSAHSSLAAHGEPMLWLTGGSLAVAIAMIAGLLLFIVVRGAATFWPEPLVELRLTGGRRALGEVSARERVAPAADRPGFSRTQLKTATFEVTGTHYEWFDDPDIEREARPAWATAVERVEGGRFHGLPVRLVHGDKTVAVDAATERLRAENAGWGLEFETAGGERSVIALDNIVRAWQPNRLSWPGKLGVYLARWGEFLTDDPREANSAGGVFPAIWGTVAMTLIMALLVAPFGMLAALYLREYATPGPVTTAIRIAINNLAGVPSIVYGAFGLGFFCYVLGAGIDDLFFRPALVADNQPTFGTGGLLWAALTLALLTLPVVIVATEEALSAVPNSMREGSYACGAGKWQTIRRIVLPRALPGIMTGLILAMARGAGEVAPLMLVGVKKLALDLPIDGTFPFVHPEREFMHLAYLIYDVGFQSPNSQAAKPMVFTITFLLVSIIALLNVTAIWLRSRLKRRYVAQQF